jgi:hypothetical protein
MIALIVLTTPTNPLETNSKDRRGLSSTKGTASGYKDLPLLSSNSHIELISDPSAPPLKFLIAKTKTINTKDLKLKAISPLSGEKL